MHPILFILFTSTVWAQNPPPAAQADHRECVELWNVDFGGWGSFDIAGDSVVLCQEQAAYLLDANTGEVRWAREDLVKNMRSPTIAGGVVVACGAGKQETQSTFGLDRKNGETRWSNHCFAHEGFAVGGEQLFGVGTTELDSAVCVIALKASDGSIVWKQPLEGLNAMSVAPEIGADIVVCKVGEGLVAMRFSDGEIAWRRPAQDMTMAFAASGKLVAALGSDGEIGVVRFLDATNGAELWKSPLKAPATGLTLTDERAYVFDWKGNVIAFDLATKKESWRVKHGGGYTKDPLLLGDSVLVWRTKDRSAEKSSYDLLALDRNDGSLRGSVLALTENLKLKVAGERVWCSDGREGKFRCYALQAPK